MSTRLKLTRVISVAVCAVLAVFFIASTPQFKALKDALQVKTVPINMMAGSFGESLRDQGFLEFTHNDYKRFKEYESSEEVIEHVIFQKKRQVGNYLYKIGNGQKHTFQSTAIAQSLTQKPDWPIISIFIDEKDLNDPDIGILPNRHIKGRKWEKIVEMSYLDQGEVLFETRAGLRVHGGMRLATKKYKNAFRLYFRSKYGLEKAPDKVILPDLDIPLRTVVIQTTTYPPGQPMTQPFAYDIAEQIGFTVPEKKLVELYINGKSHGMHFAIEHISKRQWGQRIGHDDYILFKHRGKNSEEDGQKYLDFVSLVHGDGPFTPEHFSKFIDLDNFSKMLISWLYLNMDDFCQGAGTFDKQDPDAKISWIAWDLDHSFKFRYSVDGDKKDFDGETYDNRGFEILLESSRHTCNRTILFKKLIEHSPEFQMEFLQLLVFSLNHRINKEYLFERLGYYIEMLNKFDASHTEHVNQLREFLEHRTDIVLNDVVDVFGFNGPYTCTIAPSTLPIIVDGEPYMDKQFQGQYFTETPILLDLPTDSKDAFQYWLINGEKVKQLPLQIVPVTDVTISLIAQ